jgi:UDP-N-acetylmuramoylalanine--D-glutamate ligase
MSEILIAGLGVTGVATARALVRLGYQVQVFEERDDLEHRTLASELGALGVEVAFDIPSEFPPLVITSPGWRPDHPVLVAAQAQGARVLSEIEFSFLHDKKECATGKSPRRYWIGITGTNGKTTTVGMVESIFKAANFRAIACGNVGTPVIEIITGDEFVEYLIVELSSFQLHWSSTLELDIAALLNIDDDHLDWHGNFDAYLGAKLKIFNGANIAVINGDDPRLQDALGALAQEREVTTFTLQVPQYGEVGLVEDLLVDRAFTGSQTVATELAELADINPPAPHNVANALAAAAIARACDISPDAIRTGLREFAPGHHRIEVIAERAGIRWVNDSKATNPHATNAALAAFDSVVWIAGGLAKGADMERLVKRRKDQIRAAVLIGTDRDQISAALETHAPDIPVILVDEQRQLDGAERSKQLMRDVVLAASRVAQTGDTVLLAPACASMDQFQSYAQRGEFFGDAVRELLGDE